MIGSSGRAGRTIRGVEVNDHDSRAVDIQLAATARERAGDHLESDLIARPESRARLLAEIDIGGEHDHLRLARRPIGSAALEVGVN